MTLQDGIMNHSYTVRKVKLPVKTLRRLEALGMTRGCTIKVMNKKRRGAVIIKLRGTRFAVGEVIAENIEVDEVNGDE